MSAAPTDKYGPRQFEHRPIHLLPNGAEGPTLPVRGRVVDRAPAPPLYCPACRHDVGNSSHPAGSDCPMAGHASHAPASPICRAQCPCCDEAFDLLEIDATPYRQMPEHARAGGAICLGSALWFDVAGPKPRVLGDWPRL